MRMITVLLMLFFSVSISSFSIAEIYKYKNENGKIIFTDDMTKIPNKNNGNVEIRGGSSTISMHQIVIIKDNQVIVPVKVEYDDNIVKANFLLDTGASTCTISPNLARQLKITPADSELQIAQVAGGGLLVVGKVVVDSIEVGPTSLSNVEVGIINGGSNFDGLLGMNYLREFDYNINIEKQSITWRK